MGEKAFSVLAMLVGISLFFGLILGGMASMLTNSDAKQARYEHRLQVIKKHLVKNLLLLLTRPQLHFLNRFTVPVNMTPNLSFSAPNTLYST